eukprot:gene19368-biopygen18698
MLVGAVKRPSTPPQKPSPSGQLKALPLQLARFRWAPVVTYNNVCRCELIHRKAKQFALTHQRRLEYSVAVDNPTDVVLNATELHHQRKQWLQRADRSCGFLFGCLPLVEGMEFMLTQHVSRALRLFKGTRVVLRRVVYDVREDVVSGASPARQLQYLPIVVFVEVLERPGGGDHTQLPGLQTGIVPIVPMQQQWSTGPDGTGTKVQRTQLPLVPTFAFTYHHVQGMTFPAIILDLCLPTDAEPGAPYIGLSRVRSLQDLLIWGRFPRDLQPGP